MPDQSKKELELVKLNCQINHLVSTANSLFYGRRSIFMTN